MKVELLQTILEGRAVKTVIRAPRMVPCLDKDGKPVLNEQQQPTFAQEVREPVVFTKGAIVEMSETSAKKYIEKGLAKAVEEAPAEEAPQEEPK
jgi:hypothetical protein